MKGLGVCPRRVRRSFNQTRGRLRSDHQGRFATKRSGKIPDNCDLWSSVQKLKGISLRNGGNNVIEQTGGRNAGINLGGAANHCGISLDARCREKSGKQGVLVLTVAISIRQHVLRAMRGIASLTQTDADIAESRNEFI